MNIKENILRLNARGGEPIVLDNDLNDMLNKHIENEVYADNIVELRDGLVSDLVDYKDEFNIETVVLGMSGGIDSALTASLFRDAGYKVIGITLPVEQNPEETNRGVEACEALGIEHLQVDLTEVYRFMCKTVSHIDANLPRFDYDQEVDTKIRRGNIRARLRMNTLYNIASLHKGFVASTDNFSELAAGFWTLHGDVGDVAPIQSLSKSWEVPAMAELQGVPESIILAKPTDGLGVANGDEDQFGCSYLEFDIALFGELHGLVNYNLNGTVSDDYSERMRDVYNIVRSRVGSTVYKRFNPSNLNHPTQPNRYDLLDNFDNKIRR